MLSGMRYLSGEIEVLGPIIYHECVGIRVSSVLIQSVFQLLLMDPDTSRTESDFLSR